MTYLDDANLRIAARALARSLHAAQEFAQAILSIDSAMDWNGQVFLDCDTCLRRYAHQVGREWPRSGIEKSE